jgi:hypothetical protein
MRIKGEAISDTCQGFPSQVLGVWELRNAKLKVSPMRTFLPILKSELARRLKRSEDDFNNIPSSFK